MAVWQPRSIAGNVWPSVPPPPANQLWTMYLELERTQWLSPAEVAAGQLAQLRTLLAHCAQHVPYYQDIFREANLKPADVQTPADVGRLPLLRRDVVQKQGDRMFARSLPAGSRPTTTSSTSGAAGSPVEVRQTNLVNLWWFAFNVRDLDWCGVDPRGTLAILRGLDADNERVLTGFRRPAWNDQFPLLFENGPAHVMAVHQDPLRQLEWLERIDADYVLSYPSNLETLATLFPPSGRRFPRLKLLLAISETLTDATRTRIETGFGVPVRNTWGCAEAGYLASPCPHGHGLHVHGENVLLEVLDDQDKPCRPGETGRVVLTTLHNFLNPLIRYELLDRATLAQTPCPCGRGLPLLTAVTGKFRPQFRLAGGRRKDASTLVRRLRALGTYERHQINQQAMDHVIVRLIASAEWVRDNSARIVRLVQQYFETPILVDIERVDRLEASGPGQVADVMVSAIDG